MKNEDFAILTLETQEKQGSRWITTETKTKTISKSFYNNITDEKAIRFFRNLGGIETVQRNYTKMGYLPVRILSTSPNRETRIIRNFEIL